MSGTTRRGARAGAAAIVVAVVIGAGAAATLLGVELSVDDVVGHMVIGFPNSLPPQTPEHRERVGALTAAAAELDGFEITGAWYAGTGLAAVVPHGRAVAEKLVVKHDDDDAP